MFFIIQKTISIVRNSFRNFTLSSMGVIKAIDSRICPPGNRAKLPAEGADRRRATLDVGVEFEGDYKSRGRTHNDIIVENGYFSSGDPTKGHSASTRQNPHAHTHTHS